MSGQQKSHGAQLMRRSLVLATVACLTMAAAGCATDVPQGAPAAESSAATVSFKVATSGPFKGLAVGSNEITPTVEGDTVSIDVGAAAPIKINKGKKLKIGWLGNASCVGYDQIQWAYAQKQAEAYGYDIELVQNCFDAGMQATQAHTAIDTHKYDAIILAPVDGAAMCDTMSKDAPAAGILVIVVTNPICGVSREPLGNQYIPGTLAYVGGATGAGPAYQYFFENAFAEQKGAKGFTQSLVPGIFPGAPAWQDAVNAAAKISPVDVTQLEVGAADAASARAAAEQYLNDNKDAKFAVSLSWEGGEGVVEAVRAAGLEDQVKVYVSGADPNVLTAMRDGRVAATNPYYPGQKALTAIQILHESVAGNATPRTVANDGAPLTPFSSKEYPFSAFVTPNRLDAFRADTIENPVAR